MRLTYFAICANILASLVAAPQAIAQNRGTGSTGFGATGGGATSGFGGTTGFGGGNFGGAQSGFGGAGGFGGGNTGFGGGGFGGAQSGFGGAGGFGGFGGGQTGIGGGFGQTGANQQGGFVGRSGQDVAAMFQALGSGQGQGQNGMQRTFERNDGRGAEQKEDEGSPVRVKLTLGFTPPPSQFQTLATPTVNRLDGILARRGISGVSISIENRRAVLSGTAASTSERLLVEKLAGLEPGVSEVVNQIAVPDAEPELIPKPTGN